MKVQAGIPKTLVVACERVNKKYPGAIDDIWAEDNSDPGCGPDYWVGCAPGYCNPVDGVHVVHEFSRQAAIDKVSSIAPCTCEDCRRLPISTSVAVSQLTYEDRNEVQHKLTILVENPDAELPDGTPLTDIQRVELEVCLNELSRVPKNELGVFSVPKWAAQMVWDEMLDHVQILGACADAARGGGEVGQSLRISKQARRLERLFSVCKQIV